MNTDTDYTILALRAELDRAMKCTKAVRVSETRYAIPELTDPDGWHTTSEEGVIRSAFDTGVSDELFVEMPPWWSPTVRSVTADLETGEEVPIGAEGDGDFPASMPDAPSVTELNAKYRAEWERYDGIEAPLPRCVFRDNDGARCNEFLMSPLHGHDGYSAQCEFGHKPDYGCLPIRAAGGAEMNLIVGDREHWFRVQRDSDARPIFVRPAVRELSIDDSPFADLLNRVSDEIDRRIQSHRERLRSSYRWPPDFWVVRAVYRGQKAGRWRLPRFRRLYPRHIVSRVLHAFNNGIDRWIFDPEGNPTFDRVCYVIFAWVVIWLIAQIVRAWVGQ